MLGVRQYVFTLAIAAGSLSAAEPPQRADEARAYSRVVVDTVGAQNVWVAARRLRKGTNVTCADLTLEQRPPRHVPPSALPANCHIEGGAVARHDRLPREIVRSDDIGVAPYLAAGSRVQLSVSSGGINVSTEAVALSDAMKGEWVQVRLRRPARTLRARVIEQGQVELGDTSQ